MTNPRFALLALALLPACVTRTPDWDALERRVSTPTNPPVPQESDVAASCVEVRDPYRDSVGFSSATYFIPMKRCLPENLGVRYPEPLNPCLSVSTDGAIVLAEFAWARVGGTPSSVYAIGGTELPVTLSDRGVLTVAIPPQLLAGRSDIALRIYMADDVPIDTEIPRRLVSGFCRAAQARIEAPNNLAPRR